MNGQNQSQRTIRIWFRSDLCWGILIWSSEDWNSPTRPTGMDGMQQNFTKKWISLVEVLWFARLQMGLFAVDVSSRPICALTYLSYPRLLSWTFELVHYSVIISLPSVNWLSACHLSFLFFYSIDISKRQPQGLGRLWRGTWFDCRIFVRLQTWIDRASYEITQGGRS